MMIDIDPHCFVSDGNFAKSSRKKKKKRDNKNITGVLKIKYCLFLNDVFGLM